MAVRGGTGTPAILESRELVDILPQKPQDDVDGFAMLVGVQSQQESRQPQAQR